jgi:hypothetical protein
MDIIINTLEKYIKKTEVNKSSYWKEALKNKNFKNIYSELGFGSFTEIIFFKSILHYILSRICYSNFIFKTQYFYKIKNTFLKINRQIDNDTIRHLFTFNLIKKKIKFKNAAVIGDGKANFLLQYLILFPKKKIYSINLAETLMHDYLILKKHKIISTKLIKVVQKQKDVWFLKITDYSESLLQGLEKVNYLPRIKSEQENWIGKSIGAEITLNNALALPSPKTAFSYSCGSNPINARATSRPGLILDFSNLATALEISLSASSSPETYRLIKSKTPGLS